MTHWLRRLRARIRYRGFDDDLRRELDVHRAMSEDASVAHGVDSATARADSARALGNVTMAREDARGVWLAPSLERVSLRATAVTEGGIARLKARPGLDVEV